MAETRRCRRVAPARRMPAGQRHQRGTSLLEALVGFLLIAVGMLGSAQMQLRLRESVDLARQQADAARIARAELENLRAFSSHEPRPGHASFASIRSQSAAVDRSPGSPTAYHVERLVSEHGELPLKEIEVGVAWADRRGAEHRRSLFTVLGGQAPALVLPLGQKAAAGHGGAVFGRHAAIPHDAADLGDGRSVFKPLTNGSEAWLFDNRSARIVARCAGIPANRTSRQLLAADLSQCAATGELLLGGRIRFSLPPPPAQPDASAANDAPLEMSIQLLLSSLGHAKPPDCRGEAVRMVDIGTPGAPRPIAVAIDATAAGQGLAGWTELGERFWRYHCAIAPAPAEPGAAPGLPHWSGRLQVTPNGWSVGDSAGTRRICRYSADTDGSGLVDRSAESPGGAVPVTDNLIEQNYLIVDGRQSCPARLASSVASGRLPWSDLNPATVPHQP